MFFHPPRNVETTVFARLPDEFRTATSENEWVRAQPGGSPATSLHEGPSFGRDGALWCVDIANGRVFRVSPSGAFELRAEYDDWPNGLTFHRRPPHLHHQFSGYKNGISEMDPVSGKVRPWLERAGLKRFKAVNDLFFGADGALYFTDQSMTGLHDPA